MPEPPHSVDPVQLGAYFALVEVSDLLRYAIEQQLREVGGLTFVRFQILMRLRLSPTGSHRMTDLADAIVHSRSGLTYQAGLLEKAGLVAAPPDDERGVTVTITDAGRALSRRCSRATRRSSGRCSSSRSRAPTRSGSPTCWSRCATTCARPRPAQPRRGVAGRELRPNAAQAPRAGTPLVGRRSRPDQGRRKRRR